MGDWSVIEPKNHVLIHHGLTLAEIGRELGVLADYEDVEGEGEGWHTIILKISDATNVTIPRSFQIRARHFTRPVRDALRDAYPTAGTCIEADTLLLMTVLSGWRHIYGPDGAELPFTRENVRLLLDNFLGLSRLIVRTLLQALAKEVFHDGL